jgi:hypothetical protein
LLYLLNRRGEWQESFLKDLTPATHLLQ